MIRVDRLWYDRVWNNIASVCYGEKTEMSGHVRMRSLAVAARAGKFDLLQLATRNRGMG